MDSAFTNVTTSGYGDLFSSASKIPLAAGSGMSPTLVDRTARMASFALHPESEVMGQYQQLVNQYSDDIQKFGDDEVRSRAAAMDTARTLQTVAGLKNQVGGLDPNLNSAFDKVASDHLNEDLEQKKEYALEKMAYDQIQSLAAQGDYTQAHILMDRIKQGDAEDIQRDIAIKRAIIEREVEKAQVSQEDRPWFLHATDFVASTAGSLVPLESFNRNNLVNIDKSVTHWWDWLLSGNRQQAERGQLWQQDPATFAKTLRDQVIPRIQQHSSRFGYSNHSEALNLLVGMSPNAESPWQTNLNDVAGLVGLIPFAGIAKAGRLSNVMLRAGSRQAAVDTLSSATLASIKDGVTTAEKATGIAGEEIIENNIPTGMNPEPPVNTVAMTGDVVAGVESGRALAEKLGLQGFQSGRLTYEEFAEAVQKEAEGLKTQYGRELKDFDVKPKYHTDGSSTYEYQFMLGKKKGGGYISEKSAQGEATRLGLDSAETVQDESGQWFIKHKVDMAETGWATTPLKPGLDRTGFIGRIFLSSRQIEDDVMAGMARMAANSQNKILKIVKEEYAPKFQAVGGKDRDWLEAMMVKGEEEGVWWTPDDIDEMWSRLGGTKAPPKAVHDAYNAAREMNDIDFYLRNGVEYKRKLVQGYKSATFKSPFVDVQEANALVHMEPKIMPKGRIYDVSQNVHYNERRPLTQEQFEAKINDGYALVSLEKEHRIADQTTIKHYLVKREDLDVKQLSQYQLPYRAGGHRMYADKYFVKQTAVGIQPDTKKEFLMNPNTFVTGTKAEMQAWKDTMEQVRLLFKEKGPKNYALLEELLGKHGLNVKDVEAAFESGEMSKKHAFEVMYDRELPLAYTMADTNKEFVDMEEAGFTGWLRTNGRMYYSRKGEALKNWQGERARTIDPFQMVEQGFGNIAALTSFSDYKLGAVERWVKMYGDEGMGLLDTGHLPPNASDLTVFSEANYHNNADKRPMGAGPRAKQQMEAQRDIIKRNLGWRTEWDRQQDMYAQRIADYVMGDDPQSARHELGRQMTNFLDENNPLNAVRGLAFNMKMGFFNIAQFPLQIQTMLVTAALSPEHAAAAASNFIALRRFLMKTSGQDEKFLDYFISTGRHKAMGMEPEEYKSMMRMAKYSGFFEFKNAHQMMNYHGPNAVYGGFRQGWDKFTRAGAFAFNEGETWNRVMAWQVAWKEVSKTMHGPPSIISEAHVNKYFEDFGRQVALRADDYSANMMQQSAAMWQRGLLSVPTQFWAYNARMLEMFTGKQFTAAQKWRLFIAQTLFYGGGASVVFGPVDNMIKKKTGSAPDINSVAGMFDRGLLDEVASHLWGADVMIGKRYGTGTWLGDMFGEMFGMSPYGEKSFADIIGGSTYQIMKDTAGTVYDVGRYVVAESGASDYQVPPDAWNRLFMNVSTYSYGMKAYMASKYGEYISTKGTVAMSNLPSADVPFIALGIQPGEQDHIGAWVAWKKDRNNAVKEASKMIVDYRTRMVHEPDHRQDLEAEINAASRLFPRDIWIQALQKAQQNTPKDLYHSLELQHQKDKQKQEVNKQYGESH
jgi:hypothetical protein